MTVFVDTNVLVYARDTSHPGRQPQAHAWIDGLWERAGGRLSMQVLHEYYVTVTRKLEPGMSTGDARADVHDLLSWRPVALDETVLELAWEIEDRFQFSFWDALIVAAARSSRCDYLLTEDLRDGQDLDGARVVNPFTHDLPSVLGT